MSRMCRKAHGRQAMLQETSKQSSFSLFSLNFDNAFITTIIDSIPYRHRIGNSEFLAIHTAPRDSKI